MLALKTWWLPAHPGLFRSAYTFEGISLMANAAVTVLGMVLGTALSRRTPEELARVEKFFALMDKPIREDEAPPRRGNPAAPVLGLSTIAVGALLGAAGLFSGSSIARAIDLAVGAVLVGIGLLFRRRAG